jgi:hypothetical protein
LTRYRGDKEEAYFDQFKMAMAPEDVARSIMFAINEPRHVQIAGEPLLRQPGTPSRASARLTDRNFNRLEGGAGG